MWAVMMVAMMTPSVIPAVALFAMAERRGGRRARTVAFVAGYLATWTAFSLFATALQVLLLEVGWIDAMGVATHGTLSAALWLGVAAWQFAPWKRSCLAQCRAPAGFLAVHFRPGVAGAFRTGTAHGLYCLGCCWLLMLLLFAAGVTHLGALLALGGLVLSEKLLPGGPVVACVSGLALVAWGTLLLFP
jgi:predicted metal-binding membrane protein